MGWIYGESIWLGSPSLADVFIRREATEGLEAVDEVVGCHDVGEVCAQLVVVFVMETFDGRLLDCPIHSLDLDIGPRMVWLGPAVLDPTCLADHVQAHLPRICSVPGAGLLGDLDAVVSQDRMGAIGHCLEQMLGKVPRGLEICLVHELSDCKLTGPINANKEMELALHRLNFGDIDMKSHLSAACCACRATDGVTLELLALWFVTLDIWQARDAMTLKATMQHRPGQMRNRWLNWSCRGLFPVSFEQCLL